MDIDLSSTDLAFQQDVRNFLATNAYKNGTDYAEWRLNWFKQAREKGGWDVTKWPENFGGPGWSPTQHFIWEQETAVAQTPWDLPFGLSMLAPVLMTYGNEEQQNRFLPDIRDRRVNWCQGYSETNAGSDLASLQTKGELIDDQWVINGQKIWTSTAQYSQMMFCLVRTEPEASKHAGISYLLVPMDTPGLEIRPLVDMTLKAGFNEVFFTDVTIPGANIVGSRGEGWAVANATLGHERGSLANPNATMNRLNMLIERMKKETINGETLIENPIYRDRLLQVQGKVMAFQSHALRVLSAKLNPGQDVKVGKMIQKLIGTELRHELEGLGIDIMGELGTLYEDSPHLRDGGSWQFTYMYFLGLIIGGGTSQIQKNIISERGLGLPREPKVQGV